MKVSCRQEGHGWQCDGEIDVEITVSGRSRRASIAGPAESPEIECQISEYCSGGHELTPNQYEEVEEDARQQYIDGLAEEAEYAAYDRED